MKRYEEAYRTYLPEGLPVIVRLDGRAFHTLTERMKLKKPFDVGFRNYMALTTRFLCKEIQNARFAYTQSDEISVLLINYEEPETESWFRNRLDKVISISAALASSYFSCNFVYSKVGYAVFDSRAFVLPVHEVENYFIWRWQDCVRNSLNAFAQAHFSHKELHGKNKADVHEMLHKKGLNWAEDCTSEEKNGTMCFLASKGIFLKDGILHKTCSIDSQSNYKNGSNWAGFSAPESYDGWRQTIRHYVDLESIRLHLGPAFC
jgi:tRNA(His) guanylyltransferase